MLGTCRRPVEQEPILLLPNKTNPRAKWGFPLSLSSHERGLGAGVFHSPAPSASTCSLPAIWCEITGAATTLVWYGSVSTTTWAVTAPAHVACHTRSSSCRAIAFALRAHYIATPVTTSAFYRTSPVTPIAYCHEKSSAGEESAPIYYPYAPHTSSSCSSFCQEPRSGAWVQAPTKDISRSLTRLFSRRKEVPRQSHLW